MGLCPPSQPTSQEQRARSGRGGPADLNALGMLLEARNLAPAPYLDVERGRPLAQDRLQALLVDPAHAPFGLALRIGSDREKGEMPPEAERPRPHLYAGRSHCREGAIFRLGERRAHAPALKRLCAERPDGRRLDAEVRRGEPLQDHHIGAAQLEFDREQEPDRAGAYNYDIDVLVHELWLHERDTEDTEDM